VTIKLYNTLGRLKQEFVPVEPGVVKIYNCGPTVYALAHIGNFRAFIFADLLRRYFKYKGFKVIQVMNITDVGHMTTDADEGEDKMAKAARLEKKNPWEIARFYEGAFFEDLDALGIERAEHYPRATEHIPEMISLVEKLIENGHAYEVNGNVYFSIETFPAYGNLSNNPLDQLQAGARIACNLEKKNPLDFALWKHDPKHIMKWDSPWGEGYPGWHLECSAMSRKYLGDTFDIHTGGEDAVFPHHESEIAQSEGATGKKFVNYWLHVRFLLVEGKKMAKSEGNFFTVRDLLEKGYDGRTIRYALASTHYHQPFNFTFDGLDAAKAAIQRLQDFYVSMLTLTFARPTADDPEISSALQKVRNTFEENLDDDLNISAALVGIFNFVREVNRLKPSDRQAGEIIQSLLRFDDVLGVLARTAEVRVLPLLDTDGSVVTNLPANDPIFRLLAEREEARKAKDFKRADEIRDKIASMGYPLEDTPGGYRVVVDK
jgi:cysteinyl-tRNA synthetase